jgi:hypothetical protein
LKYCEIIVSINLLFGCLTAFSFYPTTSKIPLRFCQCILLIPVLPVVLVPIHFVLVLFSYSDSWLEMFLRSTSTIFDGILKMIFRDIHVILRVLPEVIVLILPLPGTPITYKILDTKGTCSSPLLTLVESREY